MADMAGGRGNGRRTASWRLVAWGGAGCLLLAPLVAMRLGVAGVHWTGSDFFVMGLMLALACGALELGRWLSRDRAFRAALAVAVAGSFLMTWANLAVGIIGDEHDPLNRLFFAVPGIGLAGALLARFRPLGMAAAMVAMAGAQAIVAVLGLVIGERTFVLSAGFAAAWLASAWLFGKAARQASAQRG